ncbi:MAG TPA: ribosome small subunit-dependent GTPase A [Candidatus Angelobacter sp.]|nr:ribosome small subunit-dependent GTPase A [Candidatus Angelobacter sp.]
MRLEQFGWNKFFARHLRQEAVAGRVAAASREHFLVWTAEAEIEATVSGRLRHSSADWPFVGDWVVLRQDSPVITEILPRRTKISRKHPGKETKEQVLAVNIDVLFIVSGLDRDYNPRRLERYLVLASQSEVRPVILLNKADLLDDAHLHSIVAETRQLSSGTPVVPLSALSGRDLDSISGFLAAGETGALVGSSGVGKSTLLNALLAQERQRTYSVRRDDQRGRHTTSRRELFLMPGGWLLMDLPGLRELHLWADPEQLETSFDDIQFMAANCRFRDCTHTSEPGCAVRSAGLDPGRMANYQKLQRELAFLERQDDPLSRMEHKRKLKQLFRAYERQQRRRIKP